MKKMFWLFPLSLFSALLLQKALAPLPASAEEESAYEEEESEEAEDLEDAPSFEDRVKKVKVKKLSDLRHLAPFEDIAVIQKRFLPKTGRGEAGLSALGVLNKQFFWSAGLAGHIGFFIREKHGIGVQGFGAYQWEKPVSAGMRVNQQIIPFDHIVPRFFAAAYYKFTPIYGKFSFLNKQIHYFDMYFNFGAGAYYVVSGLPAGSGVAPLRQPWTPAILLAGGQVFAFGKNLGGFWEVAWRPYAPPALLQSNQWFRVDKWQSDIHISFGVNIYFPEAGKR